MPQQRKSDPRGRLCYFLNFGYYLGHDCHKLRDAETGKIVYSRDVTWHHQETPLILPATAVGNPPAAPSSPCLLPLQYRLLLRRHPHQLRRHRLQRRNPRLRSPRALVANCNTRGMRRCPGGLVAKQEQCPKHRGSMLTTTDYCPRWTMRLWCPCWRNESQSMRPFGITAHRRAHQTCQPLMCQTFILRRAFLRRKRHRMRKYGGNL